MPAGLRTHPGYNLPGIVLGPRGCRQRRFIKCKWPRALQPATRPARWPGRRRAWQVGRCRLNLDLVEKAQATRWTAERGGNSSLTAEGGKGARTPGRGRRIECRHARQHHLTRVLHRGQLVARGGRRRGEETRGRHARWPHQCRRPRRRLQGPIPGRRAVAFRGSGCHGRRPIQGRGSHWPKAAAGLTSFSASRARHRRGARNEGGRGSSRTGKGWWPGARPCGSGRGCRCRRPALGHKVINQCRLAHGGKCVRGAKLARRPRRRDRWDRWLARRLC